MNRDTLKNWIVPIASIVVFFATFWWFGDARAAASLATLLAAAALASFTLRMTTKSAKKV